MADKRHRSDPPAAPPPPAVPSPAFGEDLVPATGPGIKVRATRTGYAGEKRRRVGDVFTIPSMAVFSDKWMERVDPSTPESITTGAQALRRQHDEIVAGASPAGQATDRDEPTGSADVLGGD